MIKIATVCSGIGAPEWALKQMGLPYEIVFACDFDKYCKMSYFANHDIKPEHWHNDLNMLDGTQYKDGVDVLVAGTPCQSFSNAGKRKGFDDERGQLFFQYIRLINEVQPKVFIWENVKQAYCNKDIWAVVKAAFDATGYDIHCKVMNAKDYGIPQNRERIFVVGFKTPSNFQFPPEEALFISLKDLMDEVVDEKYYFNGKIQQKKPLRNYNDYADIFEVYKGLQCVGYVDGKNSQGSRVYDSSGIACTQAAQAGGDFPKTGGYKIDDRIRRLTPQESLRVMGFDDSFKQVVSDNQMYKQSGNSMCVGVLKALFNSILNIY